MPKKRSRGEGTVYYDVGRARWVGQVWLDGRRRKVSATTRLDAAAKLGRLQHGDPSERHADRRATVSSLLTEWKTKALPGRRLAPSSIEIHEWAAALWTNEIGSVRLADLDAALIETVLARLAKKHGYGKSSLGKLRSTLSQALRWAERRRAVTYNAAAAAELPHTTEETSRRALEPDELAKLLAAFEGHPWQAMYALMGRAGLRPGEAAGVCTDAIDVDADPPTVSVIRAVQLRKSRPELVDALKTTGSRRTIAIPHDLADVLRNLDPPDGLLFTAPNGGPVWSSTVRSELTKACEKAGIENLRPNELRHTFATIAANSALPPHVVADILGHRSTRMVDAVYRHRPAVIRGADTVSPPSAAGKAS